MIVSAVVTPLVPTLMPMLVPIDRSCPAIIRWAPMACCSRTRELASRRDRRVAVNQDRELVAAEARDRVRAAHGSTDRVADRGQQLVPGLVAERVVHRLEVVEVHEQDGHLLGSAAEGVPEPVVEEGAVRQPGERVVQRAVLELLLEGAPRVEVRPEVADEPAEAGDDEQEQHDAAGGDHRDVDRLAHAAWMTSTAGAMSEAMASIARRSGESWISPISTGSATLRMDGWSAAEAHRNEAASQPASRMCPV